MTHLTRGLPHTYHPIRTLPHLHDSSDFVMPDDENIFDAQILSMLDEIDADLEGEGLGVDEADAYIDSQLADRLNQQHMTGQLYIPGQQQWSTNS
eukprot:m.127427 g.127427  ORF g.127427 m.127427 type:complete len:95 (+) comp15800_c0_seq7:10-294(+)